VLLPSHRCCYLGVAAALGRLRSGARSILIRCLGQFAKVGVERSNPFVRSGPNSLRHFWHSQKAQLPQAFARQAWWFESGTIRQISLRMPICLRQLGAWPSSKFDILTSFLRRKVGIPFALLARGSDLPNCCVTLKLMPEVPCDRTIGILGGSPRDGGREYAPASIGHPIERSADLVRRSGAAQLFFRFQCRMFGDRTISVTVLRNAVG
jgi:hypothetical protein